MSQITQNLTAIADSDCTLLTVAQRLTIRDAIERLDELEQELLRNQEGAEMIGAQLRDTHERIQALLE